MFTSLVVLALALGIGANSAIFSVVHNVLLTRLPYPDADRLVMVWNDNTRDGSQYPVSPADFLDVRAAARTLDRLEMMYAFLVSSTLRTDGGTEQLMTIGVSPGLFDVLGRHAALGRTLRPSDGTRAIVLSDGYWRRRFGGDPSVVGRQLTVSNQPATVVGVMPRDFHFPLRSMLAPTTGTSASVEPDAWIRRVPGSSRPAFRYVALTT
jgi:hypothetical protein